MVTFSTKKKLLTVGEHAVVDQEAIAHVIGLLASQRDLNFQEVLATELTAYHPPSIFHADGHAGCCRKVVTEEERSSVRVTTLHHEPNSYRVLRGGCVGCYLDT